MEWLLGPHKTTIYTLLSVVSGAFFSVHGFQKMFGVLGRAEPVDLMSQMGLAAVIEGVGGLSIALGFYTSAWAFLASGLMAVAYFQAHLPRGFLYIAAVGTGNWGLRK